MLEYQDAMDIIEVAVRKQLPEKVKVARNSETDEPIAFYCPECKANVLSNESYCWRCGKHLDWEDMVEKFRLKYRWQRKEEL